MDAVESETEPAGFLGCFFLFLYFCVEGWAHVRSFTKKEEHKRALRIGRRDDFFRDVDKWPEKTGLCITRQPGMRLKEIRFGEEAYPMLGILWVRADAIRTLTTVADVRVCNIANATHTASR